MNPKTAYKVLANHQSDEKLWKSVSRDPYYMFKLYMKGRIPQDKIALAIDSMCENGNVALKVLAERHPAEYRGKLIAAIIPDPVLAHRATRTLALTPDEREALRAAVYVDWTVREMIELLGEADPQLSPVVLERLMTATLNDNDWWTLIGMAARDELDPTTQARLVNWIVDTPEGAQHTPSFLPLWVLSDEQMSRLLDSICSSIPTAKCAWHYGPLYFTEEQRKRIRRATYTPYEWAMLTE